MPYVTPGEALNRPMIDLAELRAQHGPPPWRVPVVGIDQVRFVLMAWQPGFATVPHHHPRAVEVFQVLAGRGAFRFGDSPGNGDVIEGGPGSLLMSPPGEWHDIAVVGEHDFYLLIAVAPNEDAPYETVEPADWTGAAG
jgi:quercetin dioxygenase-like cupin family protein